MGTNLSAPKKQRNYTLDLLKFFFTTLCIIAHNKSMFAAGFLGIPSNQDTAAVLNPAIHDSGSYFYLYHTPVFGMTGFTTIAIFTFLGGYWLMDAFKKYQKAGVIGKGKDMTILAKYAAKTYATYWPYILFGTAFSFIFLHITIPGYRNLEAIVGNFMTSITQFLGIFAFGYSTEYSSYTIQTTTYVESLTGGFAENASRVLINWNGPLWYMWSLVICAVLFFAILLTNEKIAVAVVAPLTYTLYNLHSSTASISMFENFGLNNKWIHYAGPMMLGVWGWYLVKWLKSMELSKKGKIGITILNAAAYFFLFYNLKVGVGGMQVLDITAAIIGIITISEKDYITNGLNKILNHVPGLMKFVSFACLGAYCIHFPILCWLSWAGTKGDTYAWIMEPISTWTLNQIEFRLIVFFYALCIPLYFFDKYCLKKLVAWVIRITKANEPVIIEAPKAEA